MRASSGTPPRAWGRLGLTTPSPSRRRYTPTRVGTTGDRTGVWVAVAVHPHARGDDGRQTGGTRYEAVHPHARGDDYCSLYQERSRPGTPPPAWERRKRPGHRILGPRYTPTRVGTTAAPEAHRFRPAVHPHARGDDI